METSQKIYYFSATWCGPCKVFGPIVDRVLQDYPQFVVEKKIVDEDGLALASKLQITNVPTLVVEGGPRLVGAATEKGLRNWLEGLTKT